MTNKIAFLGLGAMGSRMVSNLIQAGHQLHIWNRTRTRCNSLADMGATAHDSPREAVQQADIVFSMVRDDVASRTVWLDEDMGALAGMAEDTIAIECSTLSLNWCMQLSRHMASHQVRFLDAPVVGSRPQAEAHQLIHLVGGDSSIVQQVTTVLEASAGAIHHIGKPGAGMAMKLAVNALFGIQVAALGELLTLLASQGINTATAAAMFGELPVTSPAAKIMAASIASDSFTPLFPIELVHKDLGYAIEAAEPVSSLPLTTNTQALFARAIKYGYGEENINAIAKIFNPIHLPLENNYV